jgi:hypothetical protein
MDETEEVAKLVLTTDDVDSAMANLMPGDTTHWRVTVYGYGLSATVVGPTIDLAFHHAVICLRNEHKIQKMEKKSTPINDVAKPNLWSRFRRWLSI